MYIDSIPYVRRSYDGHATNSAIANLPFVHCLPMMYSNYGGDVQLTVVEPFTPNDVNVQFNAIAQQCNANKHPLTQGVWSQEMVDQYAQANLTPVYNKQASSNIASSLKNIECTKARLESKLNDSNTTDAEKNEIKNIIKDLEAKKEELENLKNSTTTLPKDAFDKSFELKRAVDEVLKRAVAVLNGQPAPTTSDSTDSTGSTTGSTGSTSTDSADSTDSASSSSQGADNFSQTVKDRTDAFYDAVNGIGTKNEQMEQSIAESITDGTMTDMMLRWNQLYSPQNGESWIEAFMDDADHEQAKTYLPHIVAAMRNKAESLGVCNEEFTSCIAKINKELTDSYWWNGMDDKVICENIDKMLKIIADAMGSKLGTKQSKAQ